MPGTKISELATTSYLTGGELVPIVQGGINRTTTFDSVTSPLQQSISDNTTKVDTLSTMLVHGLSTLHLNDTESLLSQLSSLSADHDLDIADLTSLININASADTGSPVFITYVDNNVGIIDATYRPNTVPADLIVSGLTVDDDSDLTVKIEWDGPASSWMGTASINGNVISTSDISRIGSTRRFEATINVNATGLSSLSAAANGSVHEVPITLLGGGPEITNVSFGPIPTTGGYQPAMFLDGDTVSVTVEFDTSDVDTISLYQGNSYATNSVTNMSVTTTGTPTSATFDATVDTTNTSITNLPIKISAKNSFGTEGSEHTSASQIACRHGPEITNMSFGTYPGSQTELKNNDTVQVTVEFDTNDVTKIDFGGGNSYADNGQELTVTPASLSATKTMTIGTSRTTVQQQSARARAKGSSSNYGQYHTSVDTLPINNAYPTYSGYSVAYPASQTAVKGTETVDVTLNVSNQGSSPTYTYSSPNGELSVPNTAQYAATKQLTCTSPGTYNISTNNYRLVVNRAENDASSTSNQLVWVADTLPTISVTYPGSRMRSGGNDGTDVQQYQIEVTSNQRLDSFAMSTDTSAGTLDGSWQSYSSGTVWRRQLKVSDDTGKGTFNWSNMVATNLADSDQTAINAGGTYVLGGFVERTLTVPSQGWQVDADVEAVTYSKVVIDWEKKDLSIQAAVGDLSRPQTSTWSLNRISPAPITLNILDSGASNASSSPSTITIEETE
jgi:hypothetical protein